MIAGRRADFVLFILTVVELGLLLVLVPRFTATDWIYVAQHILVLGIALTRHPPRAQDRSPAWGLSLASLLTLGRGFGLRPALRRLATTGPYRLVRHPIYLAYVVADVGYNVTEWARGTVLLMLVGWASLVYRIQAEERILSQDVAWAEYRASTRYRLIPGLW
jgi:Isoprenylcysteine carboxyl methyltransferase (ICMT) family